jgi:hypothetical protein
MWLLIFFAAYRLSVAQRGGTVGATTPVTGGCAMSVVQTVITGTCSSCIIQAESSTGTLYCCNGTPASWNVCGSTTPTIGSNAITPNMVKTVGQTDEYCLTYEGTGTTWAWQACLSANPELTKTISISSPTNSEDITIARFPAAATITRLDCVITGGTSVTYTLRKNSSRSATGTEVVTGGTVCSSSTTGTANTSVSSATIAAGDWLWLETTAISGTVPNVAITMRYTEP